MGECEGGGMFRRTYRSTSSPFSFSIFVCVGGVI